MAKTIKKLSDLSQDPRNLNKHTTRGSEMASKSVAECGLGRSIVADKHGTIIGGNQIAQTVGGLGIDDIIVVPSDGTKLVVVQRTDLDLGAVDDERARKLAAFDNRVAEVNLSWDVEQLLDLRDSGIDLSDLWTDNEITALLKDVQPDDSSGGTNDALPEKHMILIECQDEATQAKLLARFLAEGIDCKALNA
jgi:hypothetical protein